MTENFRDLPASDSLYISVKEKNQQFYDDFKAYAEELTVLARKSKNNKSGKASSYVRYLIRFVVFYIENFNQDIGDLYSFSTYKELLKLTELNDYHDYNKKMNRFPSASLRCYLSYLTYLNSDIEEQEDIETNNKLNDSYVKETIDDVDIKNNTILKETLKKEKVLKNKSYRYPRNILESKKAKIKSNWKCEYNSNHETFINIKDNRPYVDAHHLIPMAAQDYFENTIDFSDNIVCLCPTCHSKIHHSIFSDRKKMIKKIFEKRKDKYPKYGIVITEENLFSFYGVL